MSAYRQPGAVPAGLVAELLDASGDLIEALPCVIGQRLEFSAVSQPIALGVVQVRNAQDGAVVAVGHIAGSGILFAGDNVTFLISEAM